MSERGKGFTFIELLVSLSLLLIVIATAAPALVSTLRANLLARRITEAAALGEEKLEELRNLAYEDIVNGSDSVSPGLSYRRSWTVQAGPVSRTKLVTVLVEWSDATAHQVEITTVLNAFGS